MLLIFYLHIFLFQFFFYSNDEGINDILLIMSVNVQIYQLVVLYRRTL